MSRQCTDLKADRKRGAEAEEAFVKLCNEHDLAAHRFQRGRSESATLRVETDEVTAPDVSVWGDTGNSLHEVKRKYPTRRGMIGLEKYRTDALLDLAGFANVWYTILLHSDSLKAKSNLEATNQQSDSCYGAGMWLSSKIIDLMPPREKRRGASWRNGEKSQEMIYYWHVSDFVIVESP